MEITPIFDASINETQRKRIDWLFWHCIGQANNLVEAVTLCNKHLDASISLSGIKMEIKALPSGMPEIRITKTLN